ncbi:restriction endonuclease subunit S [Vibrio sp. B4-12]|nr:restriction endonuclease subunit S [Vibrio sp. A14(2019)]MDQ2196099.1 restriction endonuclease subunit S [Vibrio sp. 2017_1457_11]NNN75035.1 restriction endonuclease subunit S [Vibrio sp. B7]NNN91840.1 restriction endonuclease subunit S [Vibrio sp. B8-1]NNO07140.1 restriction endonuclease subunit S [Vibrio sp. B4-12]
MMNLVPLDSILTFHRGITFKPDDKVDVGTDDSVVCLRTKNIQKELDERDLLAVPSSFVKRDELYVKQGDILISSANSWELVGKCVRVKSTRYKSTIGGFISMLRPKAELIDPDYLFRFLSMDKTQDSIRHLGKQTTNISNLDRVRFLQIKIPLPPIETQKQIAAVLEKADQLRKDCKLLEQELNSLAQSVFIEMFGDPVTNPKGWDVRAIGTTFDLLTDYHANGSYEILQENVTLLNEGYALMVRTTDLERNNFTDGVNYISEHAYEFLTKTKVFGNELIVNKIGSAGKVYLMPVLNRPVSLAMNQFMIRFNEELASSIFMYYLLTSKGGIQAIQKKVKGAVTKTIRKDALREIALPIPPKVKQDEFSQFIKQHKKLLDDHKSSKEECEKSFNAIMQKAFKGELNL